MSSSNSPKMLTKYTHKVIITQKNKYGKEKGRL